MKIKLLLLFFVYSFLPAICIAQQIAETPPASNNEKKWEIGLSFFQPTKVSGMGPFQNDDRVLIPSPFDEAVSSTNYKLERKTNTFSFGIFLNHCISKNTYLQFKIGLSNRNIYESVYDSILWQPDPILYIKRETDFSYHQNNFNISPGIIWYSKSNKIRFIYGIELPFIIFGKGMQEYSDVLTQLWVTTDSPPTTQEISVIPGGYSLGLGSFIGVNLSLYKNISISTEFNFSYLYIKLGGEINTVATYKELYETTHNYKQVYTISQFSFSQISPSIKISYSF